jgi:thiol:disulfide interchange protein DsbD
MQQKLIALFAFLFVFTNGIAQVFPQPKVEKEPIHWSYKIKQMSSDEYELIFQADLKQGWHIFSQKPGDNSLIPPTFSFDNKKTIQPIGTIEESGKLIEATMEGFEHPLRYYENQVFFVQRVKSKAKISSITGEHHYQLCNDQMCLPPATQKFEFTLTK